MSRRQALGSPSLRRFAAAGLALLFASGQFLSELHLVLVEHETCEHGELVHGGAHGAIVDIEIVDAPAVLRAAGVEGHEHCSAPCRHEDSLSLSVSSVATPMLHARAPERVRTSTSVLVAQRDLFRLAPKQSPPA